MASTERQSVEATRMTERLQVQPELDRQAGKVRPDDLSLLFPGREAEVEDSPQPECFRDLYLDQVLDAMLGGDDFGLRPLFHQPLHERQAVEFRQAVFRDLESDNLRPAVDEFTVGMRTVRAYLTLVGKQRHRPEQERWLLDAALTYCEVIRALDEKLAAGEPRSAGLRAFARYLAAHRASAGLTALEAEARAVRDALAEVRYCVRIKGLRVTVQAYEGESDYSAEVERVFARFRESDAESHLLKLADPGSMDHVEARIADRVRRLHPGEFRMLDDFCARHAEFVDPVVARAVRDLQFYISYQDYVARLEGLPRTYPVLVDEWQETAIDGGVDIALASKPGVDPASLVPNGFALRGVERIAVVTGPNQGGKTTFSRMIGQLHYLAALGVPVPARGAQLVLCDQLFALYSRPEDVTTLRGRLDQELFETRQILDQATDRSLVLLNEVFASTTLADAVDLGTRVIGDLVDIGCAAVWVTFLDELAGLGGSTLSLVASVDPDDPTRRTFEVVPKVADGRAYASAIAEKYGLSYDRLSRKLAR
jgi:DNA mismatch repair protein MutS